MCARHDTCGLVVSLNITIYMQAEVSPPECKLIARTRLENSMVQIQMLALVGYFFYSSNYLVSLSGWLFILQRWWGYG